MPAQGKIPKPHILNIVQAAADLLYGTLCNGCVVFVEFKPLEKLIQRSDAHIHQFSNGLPGNLHISCLLAQTATLTLPAHGLTRISCKQVLVLYLVAHGLHHLKERRNSHKLVVSVPKKLLLLLGKLSIRLVYREPELVGNHHELLLELAHYLAPPACNGTLVYRKRCIWNHQALINANHAAVASAHRTRSNRIVVAEQQLCRLLKTDTVRLKNI